MLEYEEMNRYGRTAYETIFRLAQMTFVLNPALGVGFYYVSSKRRPRYSRKRCSTKLASQRSRLRSSESSTISVRTAFIFSRPHFWRPCSSEFAFARCNKCGGPFPKVPFEPT